MLVVAYMLIDQSLGKVKDAFHMQLKNKNKSFTQEHKMNSFFVVVVVYSVKVPVKRRTSGVCRYKCDYLVLC